MKTRKTREEIENEYTATIEKAGAVCDKACAEARATRDAALAELEATDGAE